MVAISGYLTTDITFEIVDFCSEDLNENTEASYEKAAWSLTEIVQLNGSYSDWREHESNRWQIKGNLFPSFFQDYYLRIHCTPLGINLGTIATTQERQFFIWNAYPYNPVNLYEILISDQSGIIIEGQSTPYEFSPLQELTYDLTVDYIGTPVIYSEILFDFSDYPDPLPLILTGDRIIKFDVVPEVPVIETWEWLTDIIDSDDGSEQRISILGEVPRIEQNINVIFENQTELRSFYTNLLICKGFLWVPEFQYATRVTSESSVGELNIYFDNSKIDVRELEYILIKTPTGSEVIKIETIESFGCTTIPLIFDIPLGSFVIPGSAVSIEDNSYLERFATNEVGKTTLNCKLLRQRESLARAGSSFTFDTFLDTIVLDDRSLADDLLKDVLFAGLKSVDNQTGLESLISRWDYSRTGTDKSFKFNRVSNYEKLDYWKLFFAHCRGQCKKFWVPTYREDLNFIEIVSTSSFICSSVEYARKTFTLPTHRYLEFETEGGIHRVSVLEASAVDDTSLIEFEPALPVDPLWALIKRVSFLLPVRLNSDTVTLKHYHNDTTIEFSVRTAEA